MNGPMIGLVGDTLTFCGGLLLAYDAIKKETEFNRKTGMVKAGTNPLLARLHFVKGGLEITDESNAELFFIRRSALLASIGCVILSVGFACLFVARACELFK